MKTLRVALGQINPTLGDVAGNVEKMKKTIKDAEENGAELIVLPELVISGYPPQDTLTYDGINRNMENAEKDFMRFLCGRRTRAVVVWGNIRRGVGLRNSAKIYLPDHAWSGNDKQNAEYQDKRHLPNYGVFDENRYFRRGEDEISKLFTSESFVFGATICEDIWYQQNYLADFALNGGQIIVNINASPFHEGKPEQREQMIRTRARDNQMFILYCNTVGGQDGVVFDGDSLAIGPFGELIARAKMFEEDILYADLPLEEVARARLQDTRLNNLPRPEVKRVSFTAPKASANFSKRRIKNRIEQLPKSDKQLYNALVLMTRDYVRKNGFDKVVIGASGGIDSSLVAAIACDALGSGNVHLLLLPSNYSSKGSIADAKKLANNLTAWWKIIPIQGSIDALKYALSDTLGDVTGTLTEENLQARARAVILMAYSNKNPGTLVLSTGNKSEVSVGYSTLYGDSVGAFDPLLDVYKTRVYQLAEYRNLMAGFDVIPQAIIEKAPSAELKENQEDTDFLPPYSILDELLKLHIEGCMTSEEIIQGGFCEKYDIFEEEVRRVTRLVQQSEYKRQQTTLGSRVSPIAFGVGRRMPNVDKFKL